MIISLKHSLKILFSKYEYQDFPIFSSSKQAIALNVEDFFFFSSDHPEAGQME